MSMAPLPDFDLTSETDGLTATDDNRPPCPGIPGDDVPCGNKKEPKGGYCSGCRKRYQRQRYANQKGGSVREYHKADAKDSDPFCNSCGSKAKNSLGQIYDKRDKKFLPIPLVCRACYEVLEVLWESRRGLQVTAMCRFIEAHRDALGLKASTALDENVRRILYARWFQREMEFQQEFADANDGFIVTPPRSKDFEIDPDEYAKVAAKLSSSGVLGLPELMFQVINSGGEPERTRFYG